MSDLNGKPIDTVLTEFYGPITGRNYNINGTSPAPTITVQLIGTGEVRIEENQTRAFKGNPGTNNYTYDSVGDENAWNTVSVITGNSPAVTLPVTADDVFSSIRAVVIAVGTGKLIVQSNWK